MDYSKYSKEALDRLGPQSRDGDHGANAHRTAASLQLCLLQDAGRQPWLYCPVHMFTLSPNPFRSGVTLLTPRPASFSRALLLSGLQMRQSQK